MPTRITPDKFLRSLYLGDRACKGIDIRSWDAVVRIQIDCLSRLRPGSDSWDYYTEQDIEDGFIVFKGVRSFGLTPPGILPSDYIELVTCASQDSNEYTATFRIGGLDEKGQVIPIEAVVVFREVSLEDPKRPGVEVTE